MEFDLGLGYAILKSVARHRRDAERASARGATTNVGEFISGLVAGEANMAGHPAESNGLETGRVGVFEG